MNTSTLRFNGTDRQAREHLVHLLRAFPHAFFRERDSAEYEVTADPSTLKQLETQPGWSLTPVH